ncbi:MAG: CRISPR-associated endoribonuclease Cas6 [Syntrophomonadales bacterium]
MRVRISLYPEVPQEKILIPMDFRRHFISLLKMLLNGSPFNERFEESKPGYSPYVFGIQFGKIHAIDSRKEVIIVQPPVLMTFSTGLYDLMTDVCNMAIAMKGTNTVLGLILGEIQLMPNTNIRSDEVEFELIGHATLRGRDEYVNNANPAELEEAINKHLQTKLGFLNQYQTQSANTIYTPIRLTEHRYLTKGVCRHYNGLITSIKGRLTLSGYPSSLQFLYDYGLGVRTGQGFGLLEVVNQL